MENNALLRALLSALSKYIISFSICLGLGIFASEQDSLFAKLKIIILEMKGLLKYALIWNIFKWIDMWGIVLWNVLDEPLQLKVNLLVLKTSSSKVNLEIISGLY